MIKYKSRITSHGTRQLELQMVYPLSRTEKRKEYFIDFYIYSPYQLGITRESYGTTRFLQDMRSYTRYEVTSLMSLAKLADPACDISPLARILSMLQDSASVRDINEKAVLHELRGLATMFHSQLREIRRILTAMVKSEKQHVDMQAMLDLFLHDLDVFLERFRSLRPLFIDPRLAEESRVALDWAYEMISLTVVKTLARLFELLAGEEVMKDAVRIRLDREEHYRKAHHYPVVADAGESTANEYYLYRESQLKKWSEAFMFMNCEPSQTIKRLAQIIMGVAAGAAMAFAVIATIFASQHFASNSIPWAVIIIVAYIVKDRIKELLRNGLIAFLPRVVADQINDLVDPASNTKVGFTRARVRFCSSHEVPDVVQQLRNLKENAITGMIPAEEVIHFSKYVRIDSQRFMKNHRRLEALADIMRLKLDAWLQNMDDPVNDLWRLAGKQLEKIPARRVYHMTLIVGLAEKGIDATPSYFRYRLVLTREGIVRIEEVET